MKEDLKVVTWAKAHRYELLVTTCGVIAGGALCYQAGKVIYNAGAIDGVNRVLREGAVVWSDGFEIDVTKFPTQSWMEKTWMGKWYRR